MRLRRAGAVAYLTAIVLSGCGPPANVVTTPTYVGPKMTPYAREILDARMARLDVDNETREEWRRSALRECRDFVAGWLANIPDDKDVDLLLHYASHYIIDIEKCYDRQDALDVWTYCRNGAEPFEKEGTTPKDVLGAFCVSTKRMGKDRRPGQDLKTFVALYKLFRARDHLTHNRTVQLIWERWESGFYE